MTGASDVLDPVEAARNDIGRSKRLIASTLDDLTEHHSWLESYHREERRRAQRLRRQDALRRLERRGQRAGFALRRIAVTSYAVTRAAIARLIQNGRAFSVWASPRAEALSRRVMCWTAAAAAWSWATSRSLSRRGLEASAEALTRTIRASDEVGVVFRRHASRCAALVNARAAVIAAPGLKRATVGWTRTRHRARRAAITVEERLADGWSSTRNAAPRWFLVEAPRFRRGLARQLAASTKRTRLRTEEFSRAVLKIGMDGWSWGALRVRYMLTRHKIKHRALIVRPGTALACIEPWRARCPAVWTEGR